MARAMMLDEWPVSTMTRRNVTKQIGHLSWGKCVLKSLEQCRFRAN